MPGPPLTTPFRGSAAVAAGSITKGQLRGRTWRRLLPDVYAHHGLPLDHRVWCEAVGLVLPPGAAIGGLSAACLWGAELVRRDAPVSVVTPRDQWISQERRIIPHYTVFGPADLTTLPAIGLPLTTPERTAFDLGRRLRRADALVAIDALLGTGNLDPAEVVALARERHHWPRAAQLDEVLRLADGRAGSPMETRMRLLFHDAGLPAAQPQFEVRDDDGHLIGRVDLGWKAARLAAEYEGDHHRERDQFRNDIARINALNRVGWTVLRFAADDVLRRPKATASLVATELARRTTRHP